MTFSRSFPYSQTAIGRKPRSSILDGDCPLFSFSLGAHLKSVRTNSGVNKIEFIDRHDEGGQGALVDLDEDLGKLSWTCAPFA